MDYEISIICKKKVLEKQAYVNKNKEELPD